MAEQSGFWNGFGSNFNKYVGVLIDSQVEKPPQPTKSHQAVAHNPAPAQDAAGNSVSTQQPLQHAMMANKTVIYIGAAVLILILVLVIFKVFGVI